MSQLRKIKPQKLNVKLILTKNLPVPSIERYKEAKHERERHLEIVNKQFQEFWGSIGAVVLILLHF